MKDEKLTVSQFDEIHRAWAVDFNCEWTPEDRVRVTAEVKAGTYQR